MINKFSRVIFLSLIILKFTFTEKFLFSVIISIYNTGRYLDDSISSILNQTIDLKNIQIILINDGSTDESEKICLKYKENYSENILYIRIEHSGVSKARNIGIEFAKGKFINFLDSDDRWDNEAFKYALNFFNVHKNINIIGCRILLFETTEKAFSLDYQYYRTRIVNLTKEYNIIHQSVSSSFFRYSLIKNAKFPEGIFTGEDVIFIYNILLLNPLLGLIKESIYYYRIRSDSTSTVQNQIKNEDFYFTIIKSVHKYLIDKTQKLYNTLLPFIQFYLANSILYRIKSPAYMYIEPANYYTYCKKIENVLNLIDDKYIIEQQIFSFKEKFIALSKKYHRDIRNEIIIKNESFYYSRLLLTNFTNDKNIFVLRMINIKNNIIHLEGKDNCFLRAEKVFYSCKLGNQTFYPKYTNYSGDDFKTIYGNYNEGRIVVFDIVLETLNNKTLQFFLTYENYTSEIFPSLGSSTHLPSITNGYCISGEYIMKFSENRIHLYQYNENNEKSFEKEYCEELKKLEKYNIIKYRTDYIEYRNNLKDKRKTIWIINDNINKAGDNGEYFFRYLKKIRTKKVDYFFAIKKSCKDYKRLKSLGNILALGSEMHLNTFLKTNKIISSSSESWVDNPFGEEEIFVRDLYHFDYIYIRHDILKEDLSKYLNRIKKHFDLIITSSLWEYESILNKKYDYNMSNLLLTGLPRYDYLKNLQTKTNTEKIVMVFPSYRMYMEDTFNSKVYKSIYSRSFNSTKFFNFYNNLINDKNLLINMEKLKYRGIFCLNHFFSQYLLDFKPNEIFSVSNKCDYQELTIQSSLLVTDYSHIFFDFAYLEKPIIYTHFDYEEYRKNHFPEDYFDYIREGFGPVCFDFISAINLIISQITKGCLIEKIYSERINQFFKYRDKKNCERLYLYLLNSSYNLIEENNDFSIFLIIIFWISTLIKIYFKKREIIIIN